MVRRPRIDLPSGCARAGFDPDAPRARSCGLALTQQLLGFPRHLSQHPGGFVLAASRSRELVPVENAAMADRTVIQWDKDDLDALGLLKVDVLALGMLSGDPPRARLVGAAAAARAFAMQDIPAEDPATYEMICARRHRRRVPDREPRADGDAAAAASRAASTTW